MKILKNGLQLAQGRVTQEPAIARQSSLSLHFSYRTKGGRPLFNCMDCLYKTFSENNVIRHYTEHRVRDTHA